MIGFNIETLIMFYMAICVALIIYNLLYVCYEWFNLWYIKYEQRQFTRAILGQLRYYEMTKEVDGDHIVMMERKLKNFHSLESFQRACDEVMEEPHMLDYLTSLIPTFQRLARSYEQHEDMEKAYFSWLIARLYHGNEEAKQRLSSRLLPYLSHTTIYCRENTLSAIYALGNISVIEKAFNLLNEQRNFHHAKLLTDGLLKFQGDVSLLCETLWRHHEEWDQTLMMSVIDYIRFRNQTYGLKFLPELKKESTDLEIRLAILRYYRKYQIWEAYEVILDCVNGKYGNECTIVACAALENYPKPETIAVLKLALTNANWYVRKNAAASLIKLGTQEDFEEILTGNDRFAREMLAYTMALKEGTL